jgi:hypothetical protein
VSEGGDVDLRAVANGGSEGAQLTALAEIECAGKMEASYDPSSVWSVLMDTGGQAKGSIQEDLE